MAGSSFMRRIMVFIDGEYFEKYIRNHPITDKKDEGINYHNLADFLKNQTKHQAFKPILVKAFYYNAIPNMDDLDNLPDDIDTQDGGIRKIEDKLEILKPRFEKIDMLDLFEVKLGRLVLDKNLEFRQKGVDSLIATDMISKAYQKHYDEAVLLSGDSDFIEVVKAVKETGVTVTGAYFKLNTQKDLMRTFDRRIELDNYDLVKNRILD